MITAKSNTDRPLVTSKTIIEFVGGDEELAKALSAFEAGLVYSIADGEFDEEDEKLLGAAIALMRAGKVKAGRDILERDIIARYAPDVPEPVAVLFDVLYTDEERYADYAAQFE